MRSDKLGYNAPIEVYDKIYYRYSEPDYSITEMPLSSDDCDLLRQAISLIKTQENYEEIKNVLSKVQNRLQSLLNYG
ncbi:MAG: hypothetical protein MJ198_10800 [Bacteroidales bacterium]|nr:hypothetical protein [Bacteroidales bacterium]